MALGLIFIQSIRITNAILRGSHRIIIYPITKNEYINTLYVVLSHKITILRIAHVESRLAVVQAEFCTEKIKINLNSTPSKPEFLNASQSDVRLKQLDHNFRINSFPK